MERYRWQVLAGLTLLGAGLRFASLDLQSYHHDEAVTAIRVLDHSFGGMLDQVADAERSGPGYYAVAWLWSQPFGTGEAGLRSLSAVFGTLTIPAGYLVAARLASVRGGLIAAGLIALCPLLIWYSQEARSYAMVVLLSVVALYYLAAILTKPSRRAYAGWVVASVAALATHYFAAFLIAPQAAWLFFRVGGRDARAAVLATAAASVPLMLLAKSQSGDDRANEFVDEPLLERLADFGVNVSMGEKAGFDAELAGIPRSGLIIAILAVALGVAGIVLLMQRATAAERTRGLLMLGIGACAVVLPAALAVAGLDLVKQRNLVGAVVPLLLAVAIGFATLRTGRTGLAAAAAMAGLFAAGHLSTLTNETIQRDDWRGVAEAIGPVDESRLVVARTVADDPLIFYLPGGAAKIGNSVTPENPDSVAVDAVSTDEIVVVSKLPPEARVEPGFELVEESAETYSNVYRYRSPEPQTVDLFELPGEKLVGRAFTVILQTPEGERILSVGDSRRALK
jgi:hypothetical protein